MKREFKLTPALVRALFFATAAFFTVLAAGSIEGPVRHYHADAPMAGAAPIVLAAQ